MIPFDVFCYQEISIELLDFYLLNTLSRDNFIVLSVYLPPGNLIAVAFVLSSARSCLFMFSSQPFTAPQFCSCFRIAWMTRSAFVTKPHIESLYHPDKAFVHYSVKSYDTLKANNSNYPTRVILALVLTLHFLVIAKLNF